MSNQTQIKTRLKEIIGEENTNQDKFKNLRTLLELVLKDILGYGENEQIAIGKLLVDLRTQPYYYTKELSIVTTITNELNKAVHSDKYPVSDDHLKSFLNKYCELLGDLWDEAIDVPQISKPFPTDPRPNNIIHYECARLSFKRDIIEPLTQKESFSIHVSHIGETFIMTKEEFYKTFDNVASSKSYRKYGIYSYTQIPKKTYKFLMGAKSNLDQKISSEKSNAQSTTGSKTKIGREVQIFFQEYGKSLTSETIKKLMSKEYSKNQLGCNFPVLLEREKSPFDNGGQRRYYVGEFVPGYWLCSQWYEHNREDFKRFKHKWLKVNK